MMVNLVGVQHLTQALHPSLKVHIVFGSRPFPAGLRFVRQLLHGLRIARQSRFGHVDPLSVDEGASENITAVSVAPGIVDTAMQEAIRSAPLKDFPLLDNFVGYHEDGLLSQPEDVAFVALFGLITAHTLKHQVSDSMFVICDIPSPFRL